jgi:FtsP/CotA-like multicopper oxidase with cupredoxin domain
MWVYDGTFPGPTIEAESFQKIHVNIINNLPIDAPLLPQTDLGMTRKPITI